RLQQDAMDRTLATVERFLAICREEEVDDVVITGTSVLRDAANGSDFIDAAAARLGRDVEVIPGEEEARLSYLAVRRDASLPAAEGDSCVVTDIGGGSTELIIGDDRIRQMASLDLGSVRLTETYVTAEPAPAENLAALRAHLRQAFVGAPRPGADGVLIGVGGTITTLADIAAHQTHPTPPVHGYRLTRDTLRRETARLSSLTRAELEETPGLEARRAGVIVAGAVLTEHVMDHFGRDEIWVSVRGLRYGVLLDRFLEGDEWRMVAR
ncbi:Ppx/GppA family phosphatase, partial [Candidatus Poribacteria bacterium]|nr:Ppx/GppA family phosphatase [Candidatus Poribacteria bacterium]